MQAIALRPGNVDHAEPLRGDIGDYLKLGILRALSPGYRLGVAWWLFPDEAHNGDGRHIGYLNRPEQWRHFDPDLFDILVGVVSSGQRNVRALEASDILPGAIFAGEVIPSDGLLARRREASPRDYLKLGILRALSPGYRLGVAWWLFPYEAHNGDGRHIGYLNHPEQWRHFDPDLFDILVDVVSSGQRNLRALEASDILPGAIFAGMVRQDERQPHGGRPFIC